MLNLTRLLLLAMTLQAADESLPVLKQYCSQCHGKAAMGGFSLDKMTSVGDHYQQWNKVAQAIEQRLMPPAKMPQPSDEERKQAVTWIRARLSEYASKNAGDPGRVTVRRLTSAEYGYTIKDLTGIDLKVDGDFVSDSVGGEGFTNFGDVQFMQDAYLERYLNAAKNVAEYAVIGSGPIGFFPDPGKSGFEISAITRIQDIYNANGFRAVSGEGGKPFGLERYSRAFYACWRYANRKAFGEPNVTLAALAAREKSSPRFVEHLWSVMQEPAPTYPTSVVVEAFRRLPKPVPSDLTASDVAGRAASVTVQKAVVDWVRWIFAAGEEAEGGQGDERSLNLDDASLTVKAKHHFRFASRVRKGHPLRIFLSAGSANPVSKDKPVILWHNAMLRFRNEKAPFGAGIPVESVNKAVMDKDMMLPVDFVIPDDATSMELQVDAEIAPQEFGDAIVRVVLSDREEAAKGRPVSVLLGDPKGVGFQAWKKNVIEFGQKLPHNSQGEANPADKDPIPAPYNNAYNQPERDGFHSKVKYYRTDSFLYDKILDDATRKRLDQAWADLLVSFEYHDEFLRYVASKYKLDLKKRGIAELQIAEIEAMPEEPRKYVRALRAEYDAALAAQASAQTGHVEDCLRFAAKAWRRPLTESEANRLRAFYRREREVAKLDHVKAVRATIARILVSPAFLYRVEEPTQSASAQPLNSWELASRLSYFLWSSVPDDELRRAAAAGELTKPGALEKQTRRMIADPKARRISIELFGQWLGFYRFDQYRGVDTGRFPEFTDELKAAMYDESVSFFEYIVRKNRPVREIVDANYTFVNKALAKHYGAKTEVASIGPAVLVDGAQDFQRGGILRMGTVLTVTSAPLRTSPVKRGDWMLRRILGTPTPPPPANAGVLPADDKAFGGLSVRDRLTAHQRNPTCAGCHSKIDPLGFPLERYDPVGRYREAYADGKQIDDSTTMSDQTQVAGVEGLVKYLKTQEAQTMRTLSQKMIGYALGRTMLASDEALIEKMAKAGGEASFANLAVELVNSKQFRYRREMDGTKTNERNQTRSIASAKIAP